MTNMESKVKEEVGVKPEAVFKIETAVEEYEAEESKLPDVQLVTSSAHPSKKTKFEPKIDAEPVLSGVEVENFPAHFTKSTFRMKQEFKLKQEASPDSPDSLLDDKPYILIDSDDEIDTDEDDDDAENDESISPSLESLPISYDPIRLHIRADSTIRPQPPQQQPSQQQPSQQQPSQQQPSYPSDPIRLVIRTDPIMPQQPPPSPDHANRIQPRTGTMATYLPWDEIFPACSFCGLMGHNRRHHNPEVAEKRRQEFKRSFELIKQSYLWFGGSQNAV